MRILRVNNPEGVDFISHLIIPDRDYNREELIHYFKTLLVKESHRSYFLLAIEDDLPVAFLLAYADPSTSYVFLQQAYATTGIDPSVPDNMFFRMVTWASSIGRDDIVMETTRNPEAFERRWNFKLTHYVLNFRIPQDYEKEFHKLHAAVIGKDNNGNQAKDFEQVHSIPGAEERAEVPGEISGGSSGGGTTGIRPGENSPSDTGDAESTGQPKLTPRDGIKPV